MNYAYLFENVSITNFLILSIKNLLFFSFANNFVISSLLNSNNLGGESLLEFIFILEILNCKVIKTK